MSHSHIPFKTNRWWLAAEALLGVGIVALPMALGGAPEFTHWLLLALSALAAASWLTGAVLTKRRWGAHPVLLLPLAVVAIELFQLVPLPPFLLGWLSPRAAELRESALLPLGLLAWRPISLDAPSTFRALARTLALGGLVFTALQVGRSEDARKRLYAVAAATGSAVALIGFVHLLAGFDVYLGRFRFIATTPFMSAFGNSNHLAAFLTLTSTAALGLALDTRRHDSAIGWGVMSLAMGVATFLSFSRGGVASLLLTWGLVAAYVASRRVGGLRGAFPWLAIGGVMVAAALLAYDQIETRANTLTSLEKLESTKIELWPMFTRAALAFWPAGMGTGAFELAFSPWQTTQFQVTFTHPENIWFQWACEAGLPLSLGLLALTAFAAKRLWRDAKAQTLEAVMLLAVAGVVMHEVFDFALELNAVPAVAAVLLGLVASAAREVETSRRVVRPLMLLGLAGASSVAAGAAVVAHPMHLSAERALQASVNDAERRSQMPKMARAAIDRHPADWVLYAVMAQVSARHGEAVNALAWVNRWLSLRPSDAHAHVAAAEALMRLKQRSQALLEYRIAFELGERGLDVPLRIARVEHDYERLFVESPGWLTTAWEVLGRIDPLEAEVLLQKALQNPLSDAMKIEAQMLMVRTLEAKGSVTDALAMLEAMPASERERQGAVMTRARLLVSLGRYDDAVSLLEQQTAKSPGNVETAMALSDTLNRAGRISAARGALERVQPYVGDVHVRSELYQRIAALWAADGRTAKALDALMTASQLEPARPDLHYRVAAAHETAGSFISAIDEVKKGRAVDSPAGALAQDPWLDRLQQAQVNRAVQRTPPQQTD